MTTNLRTHPKIDQREKDTIEVIDLLVQEIQNNLQVMRMEAELRLMEPKIKRGFQCAFDAAENIERLLGEVRQCFCFLDEASPMKKPVSLESTASTLVRICQTLSLALPFFKMSLFSLLYESSPPVCRRSAEHNGA